MTHGKHRIERGAANTASDRVLAGENCRSVARKGGGASLVFRERGLKKGGERGHNSEDRGCMAGRRGEEHK